MTQEFFRSLLVVKPQKGGSVDQDANGQEVSNGFSSAEQVKGRFRSFMLGALNHFLADQYDKRTAEKRGGKHTIIPLDEKIADGLTPERKFDFDWAHQVLNNALASLRAEYVANDKAELYTILEPFLTEEKFTLSYGEASKKLGRQENTVKSDVRRLRNRYGELIRQEVARTVSSLDEVDDEIRQLLRIVAHPNNGGWLA